MRRLAAGLLLGLCLGAAAEARAGAGAPCATRASAAPPDFVQAVARNAPALVHLLTVREWSEEEPAPDAEHLFPMADARRVPAPDDAAQATYAERVTASGFVLSPDGFILTSAHSVFQRREVWAVLSDGRQLPARVVGTDRRADVALLKVAAEGLPVARLAPDDPVCAGQWVAALGAPFGFERTLTVGVVSAEPRLLPGYAGVALIQLNVALNPGSSGGPLFNAAGEVVGVNTMIFSSAGFYLGISFAVPIGRALQVAERLRQADTQPRAAFVALTQPVSPALARAFGLPQSGGVLVSGDEPEPGPSGGLRRGDVVLAIDGQTIATSDDLDNAVAARVPGASLRVAVWRAGRRETVRVILRAARDEGVVPEPAPDPASTHRLGLVLVPAARTARLPPGVYVESAAGAALLAGLDGGDRIVAVNATPVASPAEFDAALAGLTADTVALLVVRGPMSLYVPVMRVRPRP